MSTLKQEDKYNHQRQSSLL